MMAAKNGEVLRSMLAKDEKRKLSDSKPPFWSVVLSVMCLKVMLFHSYRSTDFEVHRNWLAITHSLPVSQWYQDETSKWTLDYPPLFAWFEYLLSLVAQFFDPQMLVVDNLNYSSEGTVLFQRFSVILTDLVLAYSCYVWCEIISCKVHPANENSVDPWIHPTMFMAVILLWNPGLLIVDHIHFQYNGFLLGILLLSIARIVQNRVVEGAFWFAVLLNLKHIYLYVAPVFFMYLLRSYCLEPVFAKVPRWKKAVLNFCKLSSVVILVFGLSFGPFIIMHQGRQVLTRLFPFKRGLTHAYWAPNFWALYNAADKLLSVAGAFLKITPMNHAPRASMTGGLVQEYTHLMLPSVTPLITVIISFFVMLPILIQVWKRPGDTFSFLRALILCALTSFMFGWHVHEKAILIPLIPLTLLTLCTWKEAQIFSFLAPIAHFSLFPLLFQEAETPIKILLMLLHTIYIFTRLPTFHRSKQLDDSPLLDSVEMIYLCGIPFLQAFYSFGGKLLDLDRRLPFLPLLLISVYCAFGVLYSFMHLYTLFWWTRENEKFNKTTGNILRNVKRHSLHKKKRP